MIELVGVYSIKNIGFGTERMDDYWLIESTRKLTDSIGQADKGQMGRMVRL